MESSLKKIEGNKYELTVELGKEELSGYVRKAESRIADQAQIDGFRKGMAPEKVLVSKVGEAAVNEETAEIKQSREPAHDGDEVQGLGERICVHDGSDLARFYAINART